MKIVITLDNSLRDIGKAHMVEEIARLVRDGLNRHDADLIMHRGGAGDKVKVGHVTIERED